MRFIGVAGRRVKVTLPYSPSKWVRRLVYVNVRAFDAAWSKDRGVYIGTGGARPGKRHRYTGFGRWVASQGHLEAPEVSVYEDGRVRFGNGRHRFAWLRDHGLIAVPVAMDEESIENARRYGYLTAAGH
jgi:hypothetical protein